MGEFVQITSNPNKCVDGDMEEQTRSLHLHGNDPMHCVDGWQRILDTQV